MDFKVAKEFCYLPLKLIDIILQKSYLLWISTSSAKQRDGDVVRHLASVDVCFYRRITRQRFKKAIWRCLKDTLQKTKKRSAIIRNNRNYLLENIQPNDELIESLLSLNCITEEKSNFIQRQRSRRNKNAELLRVLRSIGETKFSIFVKCLRQTNQMTVARIIENGGVVINLKVRNRGETCAISMDLKLFHQEISDFRKGSKPRSREAEELISQLRHRNMDILNCQLDRKTVVISTWCFSQAALECIQKLFKTNRLKGADCTDTLECASKSLHSKVIISTSNRFNKTVVACSLCVRSTASFQVEGTKEVYGVTKLRNEIYIICQISSLSRIRVYEDRDPFRLQMEIETKAIEHPVVSVVTSETENCLYVADNSERRIWKITRERDDRFKIIKWLTTIFETSNLSVSSDGQLLVVSSSLSILRIYGSDAKLSRFILMPTDVGELRHALQTSIGNFIIFHQWIENEEEQRSLSIPVIKKWVVSELSNDGQTVIRRFIPSDGIQTLNDPRYLAFDGDDQLFMVDSKIGRVSILNSDLKWDGFLLCSAREGRIRRLSSLCYDEHKKQLVVVGTTSYSGYIAIVYTFRRQ